MIAGPVTRAVMGKPTNKSCLAMLGVAAAVLAQPSANAQSSHTCEFALAGWVGTQLELGEARAAYGNCVRARTVSCTAEQGRIRLLEQRLRLLRNYIDGYCRR